MSKLRISLAALVAVAAMFGGVARADVPSNDNFSDAASIGSIPFSAQIDVSEATREEAEPDTCGGYYDHTVWYSFTPNTTQGVPVSWTTSTDTMAAFGIYTGATLDSLDLKLCVTGSSGGYTYTFDAGSTYFLRFAAYDPMTINFGLGTGAPSGEHYADVAITKMTVKKIPVTTPLGHLPSIERRISVTLMNNGPENSQDLDVYVDVCGTVFCDTLGYGFTSLAGGESETMTFTWHTRGYVGDFRLYAEAFSYGTTDPDEDNNFASIDQRVLANGHGAGVLVPRCLVLSCIP